LTTEVVGNVETRGCPFTDVGLVNGGFDFGNLSRWEPYHFSQDNATYKVASPGHGSKYMLEADFPGPLTGSHSVALNMIAFESVPATITPTPSITRLQSSRQQGARSAQGLSSQV
jgi:hypothetical protein